MDLIKKEYEHLEIEKHISEILYIENAKQHSIEWGMNYITFSPSKRIRPLLVLESNLTFGNIDNDSYILASSIELLHTYSLVHDDLPCMDDDDLRRGIATLHTIKNEAYAVLVGDALLTKAFGILSKYSKKDKLPEIINFLYKKAGERGMIYGQILDMDGEGKKLKIEDINKINEHKTGKLLELSLILGAINADCNEKMINDMEKLGCFIGHIFQLQDDILDIEGDKDIIGKNTGSDEKNDKSSLPLLIGIDETRKIINNYKIQALDIVYDFTKNKDFFINFLDFLVNRKK